jgi:hypothetical protein
VAGSRISRPVVDGGNERVVSGYVVLRTVPERIVGFEKEETVNVPVRIAVA